MTIVADTSNQQRIKFNTLLMVLCSGFEGEKRQFVEDIGMIAEMDERLRGRIAAAM